MWCGAEADGADRRITWLASLNARLTIFPNTIAAGAGLMISMRRAALAMCVMFAAAVAGTGCASHHDGFTGGGYWLGPTHHHGHHDHRHHGHHHGEDGGHHDTGHHVTGHHNTRHHETGHHETETGEHDRGHYGVGIISGARVAGLRSIVAPFETNA